ncbi:RNA polymerase sigma factor [Chitinophaga rhizophila]|uniref:Sigma-70 family RNA polymerase sigma factor n=1 Tax=Chitinophaga rhizophila TaxID=2866212 RepID=A0ABS7GGD6_9BACT|nr:sigma-70 family RNA polymerase sigma factor [Chitinophaga rhizophila]MBW8685727.1 sigma-70 family RNA polymerase sigma factor [Chitinophaga rhizophila]
MAGSENIINQKAIADHELWTAFKQGNVSAFNEMYRRHAGALYNYGYHLLPDTSLVKDAMQDLFADLWRTRNNLSETSSVKYYLFRSLRRRLYRLADIKPIPYITPSQTESIEDLKIRTEEYTLLMQRLQLSMSRLPERQQEVIRLRFYDNFSWEEIAGILQINEQSVRNLVQRAVVKMRENWK